MIEPCQFLEWDTEFFGRRIARVNGNQLTPEFVQAIDEWCVAHNIDCLYFLADSQHHETARLAERDGYRFVDIRLTFQRKIRASVPQPPEYGTRPLVMIGMRPSRPDDIGDLEAIARTAYTDSRYYADSCFTQEQCEALYMQWIRKSCENYADIVWVADADYVPVGYISCHMSQDKMQGQIGLIGVASTAQGRGVGRLLVDRAVAWFVEQGAEEVIVATQGRNLNAQRLYQRTGFVTYSMQLWYHKWFKGCS